LSTRSHGEGRSRDGGGVSTTSREREGKGGIRWMAGSLSHKVRLRSFARCIT
jgi:hypothetical protein